MITIAVAEIKNFIEKSSAIPDSRILPIYSYVKLVCDKTRSYFVKHAGTRFVVFEVDADFKKNETLIIETKPLFGFAKFSRGQEIKISLEGKNIKLDDGERTITCQTVKDLFPTIEDNSHCEKIEMSQEIKNSMVIASKHIFSGGENGVRPWNGYIHLRKIGEKYFVIGTRGEVTYFQGFADKLPEVSLEPEVISALKEFKSFTYSSVGSYDYFEFHNTLYGFLKPEARCPDAVDKVLQNFKSDNKFNVKRQPLIDFCEMIIAVNDTAVPPAVKFEGKEKEKITLRFKDLSDNINAEEGIDVDGKTFEFDECIFQPKNILTVLKDLKSEHITISHAHRNFIITNDEEDYIGAAMEYGS